MENKEQIIKNIFKDIKEWKEWIHDYKEIDYVAMEQKHSSSDGDIKVYLKDSDYIQEIFLENTEDIQELFKQYFWEWLYPYNEIYAIAGVPHTDEYIQEIISDEMIQKDYQYELKKWITSWLDPITYIASTEYYKSKNK